MLTGCFVLRAHSGYILSFYRHNENWCMQKIKADQTQKRKNMTFCLLQNTRNIQHMYMRSPILAVMLQAVLENGSTVPAGWWQHRSCRVIKQLKSLLYYLNGEWQNANQTADARLTCTFVVCIWHKLIFSRQGLNFSSNQKKALFEPCHEKTCLLCVTRSNQPAQLQRLASLEILGLQV